MSSASKTGSIDLFMVNDLHVASTMVPGSPTPHLLRHTLVTLAQRTGTLFVLCEWGGEPLYKRGQSSCLKEPTASPET